MKISDCIGPRLAARVLGVSESGLRWMADTGRVPCEKDAEGRRRYDKRVIERLARQRRAARIKDAQS